MKRIDRSTPHIKKYLPAATVRNVKSKSFASRARGWKTGRTHHFQSLLEWYYFCILEWATSVLNIREKYELPLNRTCALAEQLGINHPVERKTGQPKVMWTDFLIDVQDSADTKIVARSVIPSKRLATKRTIERLELERAFWAEKGIDWGIVTEHDISSVLAENVAWLHGERDISNLPAYSG